MWNHLLGHQQIVAQLKHALAEKRLAQAYLFSGPKGVGKFSTAKALATELLSDAKNLLASQQKITREQHPDLLIVRPETETIKIEQIRTLITALQFHPFEASAKLAIIDEAEHMSEAAQNALLKTLEEPPTNTHFILVSHTPHRLLPTIRSRCQHLSFAPIPEHLIMQWLMREKNYPEKHALRLAKFSQGSFALAQSLEMDFIEATLDRFISLGRNAAAADILELCEEWSQQDNTAPLILDLLMSYYRDELLLAHGFGDNLIHSKKSFKKLSPARLEDDLKLLQQTRLALGTTANKQLLFEQLLFRLSATYEPRT